MTTSFKEKVHQHFLDRLRGKITDTRQKLVELKESLTSETKSTAGDKHETARAFVHIEQENIGRQLQVLLQQKAALERYTGQTAGDKIKPGALVKTDKGYFYLSTSLGKSTVEGSVVFAISPQSPLALILAGCRKKDTVSLQQVSYTVMEIW